VQSPLTESIPYLVFKTPAQASLLENSTLKANSGAFFDYAVSSQQAQPNGTSTALDLVPNARYAQQNPHPSNIVTAFDATVSSHGRLVYMDQMFAIGDPRTSSFAKSVEPARYLVEYQKRRFAGDGGGQAFGYATCHWIRKCDLPNERLGSPCSSTLSGVFYAGFCFSSDTGTLECGHTTAMDDEYGERPIAVKRTTYRCPTGSPAKSLGSFISKRLLIAGCMVSSDMSFDPLAEVHVPAYCTAPVDYFKGCLLPGATNYDPRARQDGRCLFQTKGCTSSTALNYNSEATIDDPDFSCIQPKRGCTVNSAAYASVDSSTPGYQSGFYGHALRGVVAYHEYHGPTVLNYDDSANVNRGCLLAIEGCMDSTAVNYDSRATTNSGSWCIPRIPGCMMPTETNANAGYLNPSAVSTSHHMLSRQPDGLNANFSIGTTFHDPAYCVVARYGCGASGAPTQYPGYAQSIAATNYDPTVTVETICYWPRPGCLNPAALNFGCENRDYATPCSSNHNVTVHSPIACVYSWDDVSLPATPPSPALPPARSDEALVTTYVIVVAFTVGGNLDYFTQDVREAALDAFKIAIKAAALNITLTVTSGSVNLEYTFRTVDEAESNAFERNVSTGLGSTAESAQASLGDAIGVQMLSGASLTRRTVLSYSTTGATFATSPRTSKSADGIVIGAVCGGGGALIVLGALLYIRYRYADSGQRCCYWRLADPRKRYPVSTPVVGVAARVHPEPA